MTWFCFGESEEDLRAIVGRFFKVSRSKGLKITAGNTRLVLLDVEERLQCEVCFDRLHLDHVSEFK